MKINTSLIRTVAITGAISLSSIFASASDFRLDFEAKENEEINWNVVNDGVMGGLSKGRVDFDEEGVLRFSGELSLENNGGFSTVRSGRVSEDLSGSDGLSVRVKGDGRTYQLRLGTDARYRFMEVSFMAEFPTEKDKWMEIDVPFSEFVGSFRGRELKDEVLDPSKIRQIGFLLADKVEGAFDLKVDWVRGYRSEKAADTDASEDAKNLVETAVADGRFKTLAAALTEAELLGVLQGDNKLTVFAPTDAAFAKLPKGTVANLLKPENREKLRAILTYHVSPGASSLGDALKAKEIPTVQGGEVTVRFAEGQVSINDSKLIDGDISCSNGVIHVIDTVLMPSEPAPETIVSTAKAAGKFGTLLAALQASGLDKVLEGEGPFTVFAPTDEAFAALPEGTVQSLLMKSNAEKLKAILTYHVVPGRVSVGDALNAKTAETVNGGKLNFAILEGMAKVNGATIKVAGIEVPNGVIHVIDAVLIPSAKTDDGDRGRGITALKRVENAIDKGVPLYNDGDPKACADVYKKCIQSLVEDKAVPESARKILNVVLAKAERVDSDDARAWLFRSGLDGVTVILTRSGH